MGEGEKGVGEGRERNRPNRSRLLRQAMVAEVNSLSFPETTQRQGKGMERVGDRERGGRGWEIERGEGDGTRQGDKGRGGGGKTGGTERGEGRVRQGEWRLRVEDRESGG